MMFVKMTYIRILKTPVFEAYKPFIERWEKKIIPVCTGEANHWDVGWVKLIWIEHASNTRISPGLFLEVKESLLLGIETSV